MLLDKPVALLVYLLTHKSIKDNITKASVTCKSTIMILHQMFDVDGEIDRPSSRSDKFSLTESFEKGFEKIAVDYLIVENKIDQDQDQDHD